MKIVFFGDSITDAGRDRMVDFEITSYGMGYVKEIFDILNSQGEDHQIINRGNSGDRVVDLYARIKPDVWDKQPQLVSILVGINDIWHEIINQNGIDIQRFERVYDMLIDDTQKRLPNTQIILCEPFVLRGSKTNDHFERFTQVYDYAKVVKNLAKKYGLYFVPLQAKLNQVATERPQDYLFDGVHPSPKGALLIAKEWVNFFNKNIKNQGV